MSEVVLHSPMPSCHRLDYKSMLVFRVSICAFGIFCVLCKLLSLFHLLSMPEGPSSTMQEFLPADSTGSHLTTALAMIGLLEKLGGLQAVIEALGSTSDNIQEQATGALWYLCKDAGIPGQLIQLGALPTVLNFLSSANVAAQENAAGILQELTRLEASHQEIVSMGGHHALVKILQDGSIVARQNAAAALHSLANASIAIDALMDRAQLEPLVSMLSSADARTKQQAAGLLAATFSGACAGLNRGQMVRRQFAEFRTLGGMEKLAQCLEETLLELPVTTCLSALAKDSSSRRAFVHSGTMKLLLQKLVAPEYSLQEQASTTAACVQEQAAVAISELVQDPACAALAQQPASLRHILQLLLVASPAVKGSAFKAMAALAGSEEGRQHLAASGLLDDTTMCSIFGSPSMLDSLEACQYQAKLLQHLCSVNSLWPSIVRCGGPGILASSLGSLCTQVQLSAVRALYKLTIDDDAMRRAFAASSSLTHLIFLLSSPLEEVQQEAAQVMTNLALNDQVQLQLWQLGGLPPLVSLLASPSANCQACSAMAIRNLCYNNDAAQQQAADLQALRPLISQLSSSSELCQASAAWAIRGICWSSDLIRQQAADLHSLQPLQRLLVSADAQVRRHAQLTLDKLAESAAVRRQISALHDI